MLNTNNEINVKKEERKHSWSTVFAWLYLKTIGRILPKRWNRWAENILYYDKTTANNEVQTDAFKTVDESAQVDLKPKVAEKESQSVVISKDGGIQTDEVALCVEKVDKSVEVNLKSEVAEKESQSEIMSEDEEIYSEVSGEPTNESFDAKLNGGFIDEEYNSMEEICTEDDKPLKLQLAEVEGDYIELKSITDQIEKEFSDELEELRNETEKNSVEIKKKDARINILTALNEALKQDIKKIETRSNKQQQMAEIYMKLNELLLNVTEIPEKTLQLNNQEQQEEKKSLENKILELQKQVQTLEGNKEWELAGIDGIFKEVFSNIMEMLEKRLYAVEGRDNESLKRQLTTRSTEIGELNKQLEKVNEELEKLTLSYSDQVHQIEELQSENDFLEEQNRELRSRNGELEEERSKVARLKEESIESTIKFADGIAKAFEDSEKKCMEIGSLTLLDEELGASVEKLSDQLYKVKSMERQQFQSTQGSQQQLEGETIDLEDKLKIEQLQKEQKQIEKLEEKQLAEMDSLKKPGAVSLVDTVSTAKSSLSGLSKAQNFIGKLFLKNKNLERFLSKKNEELKRGFPEFKGKHFCHNVLDKAIESLSNQDNGKFESSKLFKLLENNLTESAREIIDAKVKEVVNEHCNIGKNMDKELRDDTLKAKLSSSVGKCIEKLRLNKKGTATITNSIRNSFYSKNNNSKDLKKLLREIIVEKLTEVKMKRFSSEIQELQLASSIRDKFLSPDQKMCNQICEKGNVYQLRAGINKTNDIPNSFMSRTSSTASINLLNVRAGS